mgnify:CR=1 FL=1
MITRVLCFLPVLTAILAPLQAAPQAGAGKAQWIQLFNGKDLDGWTPKITGSSVSLQLFSWGQLYELNVSLELFLSTYFGFVAAKP